MTTVKETQHGQKQGPSREEIETLCILHAVGASGCNERDLVTRLGLSHTLTSAVTESIRPLLDANKVALSEGRIVCTATGYQWLKERLAKHGVSE